MIPKAILDAIGEPPDSLVDLPRWWTRALAVLQQHVIGGGSGDRLLVEVRKTATAANSIIPFDVLAGAREILDSDRRVLKQIGGRVAEKRRPLPCYPAPCAPGAPCPNHDAQLVARSEPR